MQRYSIIHCSGQSLQLLVEGTATVPLQIIKEDDIPADDDEDDEEYDEDDEDGEDDEDDDEEIDKISAAIFIIKMQFSLC